ncbi:EsaB/YukD family protein, partial [Mycobacterium intracellulare]|uniref:EsaB/YukD family protein n=1 Tax=Mycobacterium intracellulare TaxID=1767 RepID=UPI0022AB7C86
MAASETGLCRVRVHWGTAVADLALPAGVPVAVLIPSLIDALGVRHTDREGVRYQLSIPGASALDPSTTLAQNHIDDGAVLALSTPLVPLPASRYVDVAREVAATLEGPARSRDDAATRRVTRLCGATAAVVLTAVGALASIRNTFSDSHPRDVGTTGAVSGSAALVALGLAALAHRAPSQTRPPPRTRWRSRSAPARRPGPGRPGARARQARARRGRPIPKRRPSSRR